MTASMPSRAMLNERFHHKLAQCTIVMLSFFVYVVIQDFDFAMKIFWTLSILDHRKPDTQLNAKLIKNCIVSDPGFQDSRHHH